MKKRPKIKKYPEGGTLPPIGNGVTGTEISQNYPFYQEIDGKYYTGMQRLTPTQFKTANRTGMQRLPYDAEISLEEYNKYKGTGNMMQPYRTKEYLVNTEQPTFAGGGRKLPKYGNGDVFNPADPNRGIVLGMSTDSGVYSDGYTGETYGMPENNQANYGQYAQAGAAGLTAYGAASNSAEGNASDKRIAGTTAGVDSTLGAATPWYGYAKQGSDFGKSFVPRNEDGTAKTETGATASRMMTATHTQALNSAKQGNYGMAAANILGMGNVMSAYASLDNKSSFGKFTQKQLDNDYQYPNGGTKLDDKTEKNYQSWKSNLPKNLQYEGDYDLRGFYKENPKFSVSNKDQHLTDKFKLPNHPTFSDESMYYNFDTMPQGGHWKGDTYMPNDPLIKGFASGGISNQPNAEVEKEEVMRMPNGSTTQVDGPTHEQGGVPVSIPNGTEIFSDRLKMPGTKKTFAKLAEKYKTNKEDKILSDDKSDMTAKATAKLNSSIKQKKLDELFNAQETFKQMKVQKYAERVGFNLGGTKNPNSSLNYPNGGRVTLGYQDPRVTGGFDMTNPSSVQDRIYPKFPYGGTNPVNPNDTQFNPDGTYKSGITDEQYAAMVDADIANGFKTPQTAKSGTDYGQYVEPAVNTLLQNSGNIFDLYKTKFGKEYDKEDYGKVNPTLLNDRQALIDADIQNKITRDSLKGAVNGNAGAYLANTVQAGATNSLNKARIREQFQNANANIINSFGQYNKGLEMQGKIDTEQNKARSEDIARQAVQGIGMNTSAAYKDYKASQMDNQTLAYISKMYPNFSFDKTKGWFFNKQGQPLKVGV